MCIAPYRVECSMKLTPRNVDMYVRFFIMLLEHLLPGTIKPDVLIPGVYQTGPCLHSAIVIEL